MNTISKLRITVLIALVVGMSGCPAAYKVNVPVRAFLYRGEAAQTGLGAYGYLVFPAQPSKEGAPRFVKVCQSFERSLREAGEFSGGDQSRLMVTYWLLAKRDPNNTDTSDCTKLTENYDFATATEIATVIQKQSVAGPVLVAWTKPFGSDQSGGDGLMLDMSRFSDEDMDRAFGIWKDRIVRDPSVWNSGFQLVKAREAFRNLIQAYGEQIVSAAKGK